VTETLCPLPYKTRQATEDGECKITRFCNWFLWSVHDGLLDPKITFFADEAWFHLSACISAQNNGYWSSINLRHVSSTPSWAEDWCIVCHYYYVNSTINFFFIFFRLLGQSRMSMKFFGPVLTVLWKKEIHYFMQDDARVHIANSCMNVLVFGGTLISLRLWPVTFPNLNPCDFFMSRET
jgi:hypothetical protein